MGIDTEFLNKHGHLRGLFFELKQEITKLGDCEKYQGIVFLHPEDLDFVVEFVKKEQPSLEYNTLSKRFTGVSGGILSITTLSRVKDTSSHYNYSGCEFTSVIVHNHCFGKYIDTHFVKVNVNTKLEEFIPFMITRNRSESKYPVRFVYV